MIKINKDYNDIPISLIPSIEEYFEDQEIPKDCMDTHEKRLKLISEGYYINETAFNNRYKLSDIKEKLNRIYYHKCIFCESKLEQLHVEHYRPKNGENSYYWLAYSWDNLLLACPVCNRNKGTKFQIKGQRASFSNTSEDIKNINKLSSSYNILEKPLMVNPEVDDPKNFICFSQDGSVSSNDERFDYTIKTCKLSRAYLNDERRTIFNKFVNRVKSISLEKRTKKEKESALKDLIFDYTCEAEDKNNCYLGFRMYTIKHGWLHDAVKTIMNN